MYSRKGMEREKDPAAVALGKKRWEGIDDEDRAAAASRAATARWEGSTEKQRAAIGKKLAAARAAKKAKGKRNGNTKRV